MKIKTRMIGMDLDGTLLKSDKELTQYTKDVLKRAIEQEDLLRECQRNCWNSRAYVMRLLRMAEKL